MTFTERNEQRKAYGLTWDEWIAGARVTDREFRERYQMAPPVRSGDMRGTGPAEAEAL